METGSRSEIVRSVGMSCGNFCRLAVRQSMNSVESWPLQNLRSSSSDWNSGIGFFRDGHRRSSSIHVSHGDDP